jgi:hypothetical protein
VNLKNIRGSSDYTPTCLLAGAGRDLKTDYLDFPHFLMSFIIGVIDP